MVTPKRDYLYKLIHPTTNVEMVFNAWGTSSDSTFERPSNIYVLPGTNSPADAYGDAANPMAARTLTFKFVRPYATITEGETTRLETFTEAQTEFKRMVAHGKRMTAVKKTVTGEELYGRLKLVSLPDTPDQDDDVAAIFSATFDMNPPYWKDLYPANFNIYDKCDWTYDIGDHTYDDDSFPLNATSLTIEIDRTKSSLPDYGAIFGIHAIFGGDGGFKITNTSVTPQTSFTILHKAIGDEFVVVDCRTEAIRLSGTPRPDLLSLPQGQFDVMLLEAGIINILRIECLGVSQQSGGFITVDSVNKYA